MRSAARWSGAGLVETFALALLLTAVVAPPAFVLLYAFSERWDRSLWPEGATVFKGEVLERLEHLGQLALAA